MIPPPIRFLGVVLGAWCVGRIVVLNMPHPAQAPVRLHASRPGTQAGPLALASTDPIEAAPPIFVASHADAAGRRQPPALASRHDIRILLPQPTFTLRRALPPPEGEYDGAAEPALLPALLTVAPPDAPAVDRWSGSAWLFARGKASGSLAPGGSLGGSQAGARLNYAVSDRAALTLRAYLPVEVPEEAEIALGVDVQPLASVPVRLLVERRQAAASRGRSAVSATFYGGVSDAPVTGPVRLDAYAQAGVVGLRSRDLFADGSIRLQAKARALSAGGGAWAAAQPGVERVDVGPTLSLRLPVGTLQADWRFRVAGDARPGSGPAVTLSAAF